MQIRLALPDDGEAIDTLLSRTYPALMKAAYPADVLSVALPTMTRSNPTLIAARAFFVAELAGQVIGCGGWSLETPGRGTTKPGLAHVRHFAVDPGHGGKGVGRALYRAASGAAHKAGATRFQCFSSLNAEPFYRAMGLVSLRRIKVPIGRVAFPVVLMEGAIAAGPGGATD